MSTRSSPPNVPPPQQPPSSRKLSRHAKKPSTGHASVNSYYSNDSSSSRTLWDKEDTFLPRAKPPRPLPKLDKHRRTQSQNHIPSTDLPVLDISRRYLQDAPRAQTPLSRSDTQVTASSATSDESLPNHWQPPPSWAGPHACVEDPATPKPARSLSRLRGQRRAPSNTRTGRNPLLIKPRTPEPEVIRLMDIVGSGDSDVCDRGRCPSTGVKIQYYEGWHEKPIEDVVHMMRELRLK